MLPAPSPLQLGFERLLRDKVTPANLRGPYRKWLPYYVNQVFTTEAHRENFLFLRRYRETKIFCIEYEWRGYPPGAGPG